MRYELQTLTYCCSPYLAWHQEDQEEYNAIGKKRQTKQEEGAMPAVLDDCGFHSQKGFFNLSWKARIFIWTCKKLTFPWDKTHIGTLRKYWKSTAEIDTATSLWQNSFQATQERKYTEFDLFAIILANKKRWKQESPIWTNKKQRNFVTTGRKPTLSEGEGKKKRF